ncbi:MAG: UbiA family prenyltransferase [Candidatus Glassbacteria bacterium]|nr:UbiA family prenyltransferase [Candidatus Glassbacteria bacterium]
MPGAGNNSGAYLSAAGQQCLGKSIGKYYRFTRPFTLLPPLLGMVSGAFTAIGASAHHAGRGFFEHLAAGRAATVFYYIVLGALMAAVLNAASNVLNQVTDLENDRINKPGRMLPSGQVSIGAAVAFAAVLYAVALGLAWLIVPAGRRECFWLVLAAAALTYVYSARPFRTKRHAIGANLTIAVPRGWLLKVAGWSCVAPIATDVEPWYIGGIFFLFLLGAASTKDYSDMEGDKAAGCITLPLRYGVRASAWMIAPSFVVPWLLIPLGVVLKRPGGAGIPVLSGNPLVLVLLGFVLAAYGFFTAYLLLRDPDSLARTENHPSWTHMYLLMMTAQVGFAAAYMV